MSESVHLKNKVILITGASSGIGKAIAETLDAYSPRLVLVARRGDALRALADSLQSESLVIASDLLETTTLESLVAQAVDRFGRLDVLINNAGVGGKVGLLPELPDAQIHQMINLNLTVPILLSKYAVAQFTQQGEGGTVLNINSIAGKWAFPYWSVYDASKAGLKAFSEALSEEQRSNKTRIISIYPGACATDIWDSVDFAQAPDASGMLAPQQVADAVVYALNQPQALLISDITLMPTQALL
ncbi:MAG: SDR family oxidoreductase [Vampirovibrionales bacterium]